MDHDILIDEVMLAIKRELKVAMSHFPAFNSYHEGYAVLKEEVDELWSEIKHKKQLATNIRKESIQVAAMAIRLIIDATRTKYCITCFPEGPDTKFCSDCGRKLK